MEFLAVTEPHAPKFLACISLLSVDFSKKLWKKWGCFPNQLLLL